MFFDAGSETNGEWRACTAEKADGRVDSALHQIELPRNEGDVARIEKRIKNDNHPARGSLDCCLLIRFSAPE